MPGAGHNNNNNNKKKKKKNLKTRNTEAPLWWNSCTERERERGGQSACVQWCPAAGYLYWSTARLWSDTRHQGQSESAQLVIARRTTYVMVHTDTHTHTHARAQTDRHWRTDGRTDKLLDTAVAHAGVAYTVRRASSLTHSLIHSLAAFNLHSNILHWLWLITAASVICVMARRTRCETLRLVARQCCHRDGLRETHPKYKTSFFGYGPLINRPPSLSKLTYNYNSMLTFIRVSFCFFSQKSVRVSFFKNTVRV